MNDIDPHGIENKPTNSDRAAKLAKAKAHLAQAQKKLELLQGINPFLIDLSLRENPVGSRLGQTLDQKMQILPMMRSFGFQNILLGTLDYSLADELEVDDDFLIKLMETGADKSCCYVFTDIGLADPDGYFTPSPSMLKMMTYEVPNTLHEIYISDIGMQNLYDTETLLRSLPASIEWLNANIKGDGVDQGLRTPASQPKIFINIVDGFDGIAESPDRAFQVLELLSTLPIAGISIEDDRGVFLPFQIGTYVAAVRSIIPTDMKLLMHMHSGGGFENASVFEAILNGADGVWGGLPKRAAIIGHASLGELLANLARIGNSQLQQYDLQNLLPLAQQLQVMDDEEAVPADLPILGTNAYRLTLSYFQQVTGRFMDLPPETIGGQYGYRVCPVVSDPPVLAGRLSEVLGQPPSSFDDTVLMNMIRLMRRDLRAGQRIVYDDPDQLQALYQRAQQVTSGAKATTA